jgi:hypothetical protein
MATPKKEENICHSEILDRTVAYKDTFWIDELGHRKWQDRDFVACGMLVRDLPHGHEILTPSTSSDLVEDEEHRHMPSSMHPTARYQT